ncbi:MAG: DUF2911 domain-containing protein [Ferruginibacter sp.]
MNLFKKYLVCLLITSCMFFACKQPNGQTSPVPPAQDSLPANPYAPLDRSQMDMSYFPVDFPLQKMNGLKTELPVARVIYSRPHKNGRVIFGNSENSICHYGKAWRLGANEGTEISFFKNVIISGKNIAKGSYIIYAIPYAEKWTIILNNNLYSWGLHIDSTYDIFKMDIPVSPQQPALEDFTIVFSDAVYGADLIMAWDNVKAVLPIEFSK